MERIFRECMRRNKENAKARDAVTIFALPYVQKFREYKSGTTSYCSEMRRQALSELQTVVLMLEHFEVLTAEERVGLTDIIQEESEKAHQEWMTRVWREKK